jgi:[ribosomal protein S5]-alanine N-acetyltransferase
MITMPEHFKNNFCLLTERLTISPLAAGDADFIFRLLNTEGWIANIGQRNIHTLEDAQHYIQRITDNPNIAYQTIRLRADNAAIGLVTFIQRDYLDSPDIGFALLPEHSSRGYAHEASKALLNAVIQTGQYREVLGICIESNTPSIRLLEKLGLQFREKIVRDGEELCVYFR